MVATLARVAPARSSAHRSPTNSTTTIAARFIAAPVRADRARMRTCRHCRRPNKSRSARARPATPRRAARAAVSRFLIRCSATRRAERENQSRQAREKLDETLRFPVRRRWSTWPASRTAASCHGGRGRPTRQTPASSPARRAVRLEPSHVIEGGDNQILQHLFVGGSEERRRRSAQPFSSPLALSMRTSPCRRPPWPSISIRPSSSCAS